jgi:hypothetical protein
MDEKPPVLLEFEKEMITFHKFLPELIARGITEGFVLVKDDAFLGPYPTEKDAYRIGFEIFGPNELFLVEPITETQPVEIERAKTEHFLIPYEPPIALLATRGSEDRDLSVYL